MPDSRTRSEAECGPENRCFFAVMTERSLRSNGRIAMATRIQGRGREMSWQDLLVLLHSLALLRDGQKGLEFVPWLREMLENLGKMKHAGPVIRS